MILIGTVAPDVPDLTPARDPESSCHLTAKTDAGVNGQQIKSLEHRRKTVDHPSRSMFSPKNDGMIKSITYR